MKIKLYKPYPGILKKNLNPIEIHLKGRLATYYDPIPDPPFIYPETRVFTCIYDNTYQKEFGNLKLNYRLTFDPFNEDDDSVLGLLEGYSHLNIINRIRIEWIFRRNWLQNSENLKWLISIPLAVITSLITTYLATHFQVFK